MMKQEQLLKYSKKYHIWRNMYIFVIDTRVVVLHNYRVGGTLLSKVIVQNLSYKYFGFPGHVTLLFGHKIGRKQTQHIHVT